MPFRPRWALVIVAAAACTSVDHPVAVPTTDVATAQFARGVKPPPPLGTAETEMRLDVSTGEPESERIGGPSADASALDIEFHANVIGRYMANTQSTNGWVDFVTNGEVVASPNARLQYNEKSGKTHGVGTLTDNFGNVLYLNLIEITSGYFGACPTGEEAGACAFVQFTYGDGGFGTFSVYPAGFFSE